MRPTGIRKKPAKAGKRTPAKAGKRTAATPAKAGKRARAASQPQRTLREAARGQTRDLFRIAILEAAERVFARRGFAETKVAEIAREAGLAAGTLYNYFDSKEAIFHSICELRGQEALAEARAIAELDLPPMERIRRQIDWVLGHIDGHADRFQVYVQMGATSEWQMKQITGDGAHANYLEHLRLLEVTIAEAQHAGDLRDDISAADLTFALAGVTNSFIHAWLLTKPRPRLSARSPLIFDLFFKGAVPR